MFWDITPCLYESSSRQHSITSHNTLSFSSTAVSTLHISCLFFRINKTVGKREHSYEKREYIFFNYCPKVKLYVSNIFLIIFLLTQQRFMFPNKKYFTYIFIVYMKILIIIIDIICDTVSM
jgi:hypothetical protein